MQIKGFIDTSMVDWDGKISCVIFTPNCNFRCPYCYNRDLVLNPDKIDDVPEEYVLGFLEEHADFLDGICITGGEPTLQKDLAEFCKKVKALKRSIKLDTNGTHPKILKNLIDNKLVDYVAMDVKAPLTLEKYSKNAGIQKLDLDAIKESIEILINSNLDYEFRTTVIPTFHSEKDIEAISKEVKGANLYVLQKFRPGNALDPELNKLDSQSDEFMKKLVKIASKYVENVIWRGK